MCHNIFILSLQFNGHCVQPQLSLRTTYSLRKGGQLARQAALSMSTVGTCPRQPRVSEYSTAWERIPWFLVFGTTYTEFTKDHQISKILLLLSSSQNNRPRYLRESRLSQVRWCQAALVLCHTQRSASLASRHCFFLPLENLDFCPAIQLTSTGQFALWSKLWGKTYSPWFKETFLSLSYWTYICCFSHPIHMMGTKHKCKTKRWRARDPAMCLPTLAHIAWSPLQLTQYHVFKFCWCKHSQDWP